MRSRLDDLLRPDGLTALQYTALTVLERHPDLSSAQLARNSFVTAQSMADMITALEGRGLIERHRDRADRRRLVVALTAAAGNCSPATGSGERAGAEMLAGLTRAQISALRRSLHACHANLARATRPADGDHGLRPTPPYSILSNVGLRGGAVGPPCGDLHETGRDDVQAAEVLFDLGPGPRRPQLPSVT